MSDPYEGFDPADFITPRHLWGTKTPSGRTIGPIVAEDPNPVMRDGEESWELARVHKPDSRSHGYLSGAPKTRTFTNLRAALAIREQWIAEAPGMKIRLRRLTEIEFD